MTEQEINALLNEVEQLENKSLWGAASTQEVEQLAEALYNGTLVAGSSADTKGTSSERPDGRTVVFTDDWFSSPHSSLSGFKRQWDTNDL